MEKKRKLKDEKRCFKESWTNDFFVEPHGSRVICLICNAVIILKGYNIKEHFSNKHKEIFGDLSTQQRECEVKRMRKETKMQQNLFIRHNNESEGVKLASLLVSQQIAKRLKPHSDGEFIKECLMDVVSVLAPNKINVFKQINLSRNTVCRRIADISTKIEDNLMSKISQFNFFSICFDETTDISATAQLVIFIRGVDDFFNVSEELLSLVPLKDSTTGANICDAIIAQLNLFKADFKKLVGITTDGAPSMRGSKSGAVTLLHSKIQEFHKNYDVIDIHCLLHVENLCGNTLDMNYVINFVVKTVNYIRKSALRHRRFKEFLNAVEEAEGSDVIYYTNVRWLSRGNCLKRFFDLRFEIKTFMESEQQESREFSDDEFLLDLAFYVDMTKYLNELNIKLQGKDSTIVDMYKFIKSFVDKLNLFKNHLYENQWDHFESIKSVHINGKNTKRFARNLAELIVEFQQRFSKLFSLKHDIELYSNPFIVEVDSVDVKIQLELLDLQSDLLAKQAFSDKKSEFVKIYLTETNYPNIRNIFFRVISLFGTTYNCERFFSGLKYAKNNYRSRLTDENLKNELRISNTQLEYSLKELI